MDYPKTWSWRGLGEGLQCSSEIIWGGGGASFDDTPQTLQTSPNMEISNETKK